MRAVTCWLVMLLLFASSLIAHPGSGIAIDRKGRIYFVDTGGGIWRIDTNKRVVKHQGPAFHWLAIDPNGRFANVNVPTPSSAEVVTVGADPTLIVSSDFPLVIGSDGALYFPEERSDKRLQIVRFTADRKRSTLAILPPSTSSGALRWLNGMAAGPDGSIYYTEDRAIRKVARNGSIATVAEKIAVPNCRPLPEIAEELKPYLRGLTIGADGTVYVAASGCSSLLRVSPKGEVRKLYSINPPWTPTDVVVSGNTLFVLEYLLTPGDNRREWIPRVRKLPVDASRSEMIAQIRR